MTTTDSNADFPAMPKVLGGLTPYLEVEGAFKAAEFYEKAFGAKRIFAYPPNEQGRTMHIHLHVNGSTLMLGDAFPEHGHPHQPAAGYTLQLHLTDQTSANGSSAPSMPAARSQRRCN